MLSEEVLEALSGLRDVSSKFYMIPSKWNRQSRTSEVLSKRRMWNNRIICSIENAYRIWMHLAYGYMLYAYLQNPTTIIKAFLPSAYILCMNSGALVRFLTQLYSAEMEQFLESIFQLNTYMGKLTYNWNK